MLSFSDQVVDNSGYNRPVRGASVYLLNVDGTTASAFTPNPQLTDNYGAFTFTADNGNDGVYNYEARLGGVVIAKGQQIIGNAPQFTGPTGPANSTYPTLAAMQAAGPNNRSYNLASPTGSDGGVLNGLFTYQLGNFAGRTDVVQVNGIPLTTGALVRQSSASVVFVQAGSGAVQRDSQNKARETVSVLDFGAKGDGTTDDTTAFNAAIATGKTVTVPKTAGGYVVNGITVVSNMEIVGEKSGECLGPELIVTANNGCVFLQAASTDIAVHLVFRNLTMRAASGVTGATGFRSADKSKYTAYCTFENIETHRNLLWGYDLLPIYTDWINCRDGYLPGDGNFTRVHGFIKAEAATYGQTNATNTNNVMRAKVFGCYGVDAAIQIAFGDTWLLQDCRFENMYVPAVKAQSVIGLYLVRPRSEGFHTTEWATLREMSGSGVGSVAHFDALFNAIDQANFYYATTDALSRVGFQRGSFSIVGPNQRLCNNPLALLYNRDHPTISGTGAAGLMTGMQHDRRIAGQALVNGANPNSNTALTHLNLGGSAATQGFGSGNAPVAVSSDWITIFTSATTGGKAFVRGIQTAGGGGGAGTRAAWEVNFNGSYAIEVVGGRITPFNAVVAEFQTAGDGILQMRCTTGACTVEVSALI